MAKRKASATTDRPLCDRCNKRHGAPKPCERCRKRHCPNGPGAKNCAARTWADADPAGAVETLCTADMLRALKAQHKVWADAVGDDGRPLDLGVGWDAKRPKHPRALLVPIEVVRMAVEQDDVPALAAGPLGNMLLAMLTDTTVNADGLSALAFLHRQLPVRLDTRHVITLTDRAESTRLNRTPAVVDLATLSPVEAVMVDGEPLASGGPEALTMWRRVQPKAGEQRSLFAGPRTLGGETVGDVVIRTLARLPGMDLRSPLIGDVHRVAALAFGLTGYGPIPDSAGAVFVGGRDTQANRQRWWTACEWLRHTTVTINERTGEWIGLANVDPNGRGGVHLGPPAWWRGEGRNGRWRLSGALFRPVRIGGGGRGAGGQDEHYSGLARMLAGFEARLCYSTSAGRGKAGRVPDALRPVRKGGPGPEIRIGWRDALTLAGEHVKPDAPVTGSEGRRYRRRVEALVAAGYGVGPNGEAAPAGDTVEIVRVERGVLALRASARFCAAASGHQTWERMPAGRLLTPRSCPVDPPKLSS